MNIEDRIKKNEAELKADVIIEPLIDKDYWCETCGSKSGKCHPVTGMCYICGADDWCATHDNVGR